MPARPGAPSAALLAGLVALSAGAAGCASAHRPGRPTTPPAGALVVSERAAHRCVHGGSRRGTAMATEPLGADADAALGTLSPRVRRTVEAAGIEALLGEVLAEGATAAPARSGGSTSRRDTLALEMFALESELLAMEFEVDCLRSLIEGVLSEYDEAETDRQLVLTVASLVVGAVTGIAAGIWDTANGAASSPAWSDGPTATGILGAAVTTGLGVAALVQPPGEVLFVHDRNVLGPIASGSDEDEIYPSFIFRLLTLPVPEGGPTPRDELLESFEDAIAAAVAEEARPVVREIVFGVGGIHDARVLRLQETLLEELGAALDALARDLDELGSTIAAALRASAAAREPPEAPEPPAPGPPPETPGPDAPAGAPPADS